MALVYITVGRSILTSVTYQLRKVTRWMLLAWFAVGVAVTPAPARPLRSGCEVDYPPFCIVDQDGRADGFSVALLRAALRAMGREVAFQTSHWAEVRGWLERGEVDCLPLVGRTPERIPLFDFTVPYMTMHGAIVVRDDTTGVHSLDDLRGKRVGVMAGDNAEEFLRREGRDVEIFTTPTFSAALQQLSRGECDAVVIQRLVALRLMSETGLSNLRIVKQSVLDFSQDFCFAVQEGDRDTLALLNEGLALVIADGTYRRLHAQWFAALELPSDRPLIIGGDNSYPPYEFLDENGRPAGYNVDLIRAVAQAVGLDIKIRLGPWSEIVRGLQNGEIDAVEGMFFSTERDLRFDFSVAHTVNHCVGVVHRDAGPPPENPAQLVDRSLVVQDGDLMHAYVLEHGLTNNLAVVVDQESALRGVAEGRYDCALVARRTALYAIKKMNLDTLVVGREALLSPEYCFAVPNGHAALLSELDEGLTLIKQSGEYQAIHEKWMGVYDEPSLRATKLLVYAAVVVVLMLLVLAIALLWTHMLRRRVAERTAALQHSEEKYRLISEQTVDLIWRMDMNLTFTYVNSAVESVLGFAPEEFVGTHLRDYCDAAHYKQLVDIIEVKAASSPEDADEVLETELFDKQGQIVPVEVHGTVIFDQCGRPKALQGVTRDISVRKRHEAHVEHLTLVLRAIRNVNQLITHTKERDALLREICNILIDSRGYRSAWIALQTESGEFLASANAGIGNDFSVVKEQVEAGNWPVCCQKALNHPGQIVAMHGADKDCRDCPIARHYRDMAALAYALAYGERVYGVLVVALPSDLAVDPEEQSLFKELVGDLGYALHNLENEGRRQEAEHSLKVANLRYHETVRGGRVGLWERNLLTNTVYYSPEWKGQIGYEDDEIENDFEEWRSRVHPDDLPRAQRVIEEAIAECGDAFTHEFRFRHKNGSWRWILSQGSVITDETGKAVRVVGSHIDITDRKETAARLRQSDKLSAVGQLAGGVAHDFNNLLMGMMNYVELCRDELAPDHPVQEWLDEIMTDARRSADVVRQLLAFARKQTIAPRIVDLNEEVEAMLKMLRRLIGEDVDLRWEPASGLRAVKMDPAQINQILANLCVNARDAIAGVGKIAIETANVSIDAAFCARHADASAGNFVVLTVSDNGCGMDAETVNNIFEPFYTTKAKDEGTGLGLATVYGIVKQNAGFVNVYSEPAQGTTFRVYLPVAEMNDAASIETSSDQSITDREGFARQRTGGDRRLQGEGQRDSLEPAVPAGRKGNRARGGTILLAEDEKSIRVTVTMFLRSLGYTVLPGADPEEVLSALADHQGKIDLLITDVVMPGMSGRELAQKLEGDYPDLKVLYISGYTANVIAERGILEKDVAFLSKPFTRDQLVQKVREILDA